MAKLNISQAAKAVGKSRRTIQNHIKQGKLSCETDGNGNKVIDTSELMRVYGEVQDSFTGNTHEQKKENTQQFTAHYAELLQQKINDLEKQVKELEQDREERRDREAKLLGIVKQQNVLLEDKRERKGFWARVFGT